MANPIIVVEYNPSWPELFQFLRKRVARELRDIAATVEHVGSTAVPGLAAKPIIDMDVLLASSQLLPAAIEHLAVLGYSYRGDLGVPDREAFRAPDGDPPHHLYVCPPHSLEFQRHLAFRDYLRAHPIEVKAYGDLKRSLALKFREDRNAYNAGKMDFVARVTGRALAEPQAIF
jgi:GrpB-like predicted nucleotidyltransferase (UPF0157 family)